MSGDVELARLLGRMEQDMAEGQRQRSRLFKLLEDVSAAANRLVGQFEERCKSDDEWREGITRRLEALEQSSADTAQRVAAIQPAAAQDASPRRRGLSLSLFTVVGGGGLASLFFGGGIGGLIRQGVEMLKKIPH